MQTVAVLGAGLLGSGMVENLLGKGHTVRVWNRTAAKLAPLAGKGATICASAAEAVRGASRVHLVLAEDDAVDTVTDALLPGLAAGTPIFDHSTNLPERVGPRFARLRTAGVVYLHCPVFMGPSNARAATGLMLFAGPRADLEAYEPVLSTMTGKVWFVGERPDLAAVMKLLGNGLLISITAAAGDALRIADAQGVDAAGVLELLANFNPGGSLPAMVQRVQRSDTADASFTLEMARKDVRLMIEAGGPGLAVLPAVAASMDRAIDAGQGGKDFAVFARRS